jgi:twinkle protein
VVYQSEEEIDEADGWIDRHFSFIVPNEDDDVNLEWVLGPARASVVQHNANMVVIDPGTRWTTPGRGICRSPSTPAARSRSSSASPGDEHPPDRRGAPGEASQRREDGTFQIPSLYDVSDSAHWYNKPDVGIVVHREPSRPIIRIAKSRYHDQIGT